MNQRIDVIITNTLSNLYDWDSDDIREEFISFLNSEYAIDKEKLVEIYDSFESLSPLVRDSATFNLNDFITRKLS